MRLGPVGRERRRCAAIAWSFVEMHSRSADTEPCNTVGYRRRMAQAETARQIHDAITRKQPTSKPSRKRGAR